MTEETPRRRFVPISKGVPQGSKEEKPTGPTETPSPPPLEQK